MRNCAVGGMTSAPRSAKYRMNLRGVEVGGGEYNRQVGETGLFAETEFTQPSSTLQKGSAVRNKKVQVVLVVSALLVAAAILPYALPLHRALGGPMSGQHLFSPESYQRARETHFRRVGQ